MTELTLWGTRGSLATPDPETIRFGGNTACVEVHGEDQSVLILDAGTGLRRLGRKLAGTVRRVDILLTHLHMDHILGLGFFAPLFIPEVEVHIWGPDRAGYPLEGRIARYLSPPLFPVHLRDVSQRLQLHGIGQGSFSLGPFNIQSDYVCHPNPTLGFRIQAGDGVLAYLPDHEPALGSGTIDQPAEWTSGWCLAHDVDLLIHDAQYMDEEYPTHIGWGHSSIEQACDFAALVGARTLVPFHHAPDHSDADLERMITRAIHRSRARFSVRPGMEGMTLILGDM